MRMLLLLGCVVVAPSVARAGEPSWLPLMSKDLAAFKTPHGGWRSAGDVTLDAANPRKLFAKDGAGAWYNGPKGRTNNLYTKQKYGDLEISLEFMMSKGSNSGIKFHGHYEIQISDSAGKKEAGGEDCGGIYPRAEAKPRYHHIDKGIAPRLNACKAPGEWQSLHAVFLAPRFDGKGKKIANAKLTKVLLNGQVIHENQELLTPTGDRWKGPELAEGPLMIQADHGPVAFRNVKVRAPAR
ncbi:MAG: DUF1080 domain-containing protein [Gemmataceae bacterium]|nr:DUF1080 domain-containing protein [Gemmataceae bacterium]